MGVRESAALWSHLNLAITPPGGQGGGLGRAVGQMSPREQGEAGQDPAGLAPPNLLLMGPPTRGTKMDTPTHGPQRPCPLGEGKSPTGWRLQALGRWGFIHQLIPRNPWRRARRRGWARGQPASKLVPGAAPRSRMEIPGSEGQHGAALPPEPGPQASLCPQPQGTSREPDLEPRENASNIPWALSPPSTAHLFIDTEVCAERGLGGEPAR